MKIIQIVLQDNKMFGLSDQGLVYARGTITRGPNEGANSWNLVEFVN